MREGVGLSKTVEAEDWRKHLSLESVGQESG